MREVERERSVRNNLKRHSFIDVSIDLSVEKKKRSLQLTSTKSTWSSSSDLEATLGGTAGLDLVGVGATEAMAFFKEGRTKALKKRWKRERKSEF